MSQQSLKLVIGKPIESNPFDFELWAAAIVGRTESKRRFAFSPSMLKSILQKNVRMSRPDAAVRAAVQLIVRSSFTDFVRRLSIIVVEDAILHPKLPVLMWLIAACSKGHKPTANEVELCLRMVYEVAAVKLKDSFPEKSSQPITFKDNLERLSPLERVLVRSLQLRASFGGMKGDVEMLQELAACWNSRFSADVSVQARETRALASLLSWELGDRNLGWVELVHELYARVALPANGPKLLDSVLYLKDEDVILSAIDFHCSPLLDMLLSDGSRSRKAIEQFTEQKLNIKGLTEVSAVVKTTIWEMRSSLTNKSQLKPAERPPIIDKLQELYRLVGVCVGFAQTNLCTHSFAQMEADLDAVSCKIIAKRCS